MFSGLLGFGNIPESNLKNRSKSNISPPVINKIENLNTNMQVNNKKTRNNNTNRNINMSTNRTNLNSNSFSPMIGGRKKKTMRNKRK
jgi:hypothetical protein